jgi:hypothetical protein
MGIWFYTIKVTCDNCGMPNNLQIKKGIPVKEFVKSNRCKCKNCGSMIKVKEYRTEWFK